MLIYSAEVTQRQSATFPRWTLRVRIPFSAPIIKAEEFILQPLNYLRNSKAYWVCNTVLTLNCFHQFKISDDVASNKHPFLNFELLKIQLHLVRFQSIKKNLHLMPSFLFNTNGSSTYTFNYPSVINIHNLPHILCNYFMLTTKAILRTYFFNPY